MKPFIHVVAGIVYNQRGEILLSSRPEGKPMQDIGNLQVEK